MHACPTYTQAHPAYTYSYQVSDDSEQTYIAKEESRDGDDTVGKYQYVDATGALIRVEYRAGLDGYTEERFVEPNFVVVRARPTTTVVSAPAPVAPAPVRRVVTTQTTSSRDDTDLVGRIIAQLTPFIQRTVSDSLSSTSTTTTRRVQAAAPVQAVRRVVTTTSSAPVAATATTQIFGNGGANNIRFENPDINYAFDF